MSMIFQNPQQMQALMQHLAPMFQQQSNGTQPQQQRPNTMLPPASNAQTQPNTMLPPANAPQGQVPNTMYRPYGTPGAINAPPAINGPTGFPNNMHSLAPGV